ATATATATAHNSCRIRLESLDSGNTTTITQLSRSYAQAPGTRQQAPSCTRHAARGTRQLATGQNPGNPVTP
ncbi:MAG: hypothetical protein ACOH1J_07135, partial [Microbacteriaceae bacterium]